MSHTAPYTEPSKPNPKHISIILVHGTGSSQEGAPGAEKWWQPESPFSRSLVERLRTPTQDGKQYVVEAFKWSGDNSESERRAAGAELAARISEMEKADISYHLIGHSHGGSVLWHALVKTCVAGKPLRCLRSWITIGTPFLKFSPRSRWYLILALSVLVQLGIAWMPVAQISVPLLDDASLILTDSPPLAIVTVLLGLLGLLGLSLFPMFDLYRQVHLRVAQRWSCPSTSNLTTLSKHWLGIIHDLDEPLNGLAASLNPPPEILPRAKRPIGSGFYGTLRYWVKRPYDRMVAPIIDAFVWDIGISRLQGRDVAGAIMKACDASPACLPVVCPPLPADLDSEMSQSADQAAARTAAAFRERLLEVGAGTEPPERISRAISWDEVIHTSYFTNPRVAELCCDFIRGQDEAASATFSAISAVSTALSDGMAGSKTTRKIGKRSHFEPINMYLARSAGLATSAFVLSFGIFSASQAWLLPYTNRHQIDVIANNMTAPQFTRLWESPVIGKVLIRLLGIGATDEVFNSLSNIRNPNTSIMAAELIAYGLGFYGDEAGLARLLNDYASIERGQTLSDPKLILDTYALVGAIVGDSPLKNPLAEKLHGLLTSEVGVDGYGSGYGSIGPWEIAAGALLQLGRTSDLNILLDGIAAFNCDGVQAWLTSNLYRLSPPTIPDELKTCLGKHAQASVVADSQREQSSRNAKAKAQPPDPSNPYDIAEQMSALLSRKDYSALSSMVLSLNEDLAKRVVEVSMIDCSEVISALAGGGMEVAANRLSDLYEWSLRDRMDSYSTSIVYRLDSVRVFADGMTEIDKRLTLEADAARFETAALGDGSLSSFDDGEAFAAAGVIRLKLDEMAAAKADFSQAIGAAANMGESGFPFAMKIANIAATFDKELTKAALLKAISLFEDVYRIDSVPDYSYTLDDVVSIYSAIGEYRLAREVAERVGQNLWVGLSGQPAQHRLEDEDIASEKSSLTGGGVLSGYIRILDVEIKRRSGAIRRKLFDNEEQWPEPKPIYNTSFNRG